ncbi:MAG: SprT-like domain-containing protein [Verrucomicrobiae bacterium]|nr:SprT-like domain-containing protein [Verrucomicrobiae bacterium]NNJ87058.1 hypothetical protein [Akkermansiaceae bacterium]
MRVPRQLEFLFFRKKDQPVDEKQAEDDQCSRPKKDFDQQRTAECKALLEDLQMHQLAAKVCVVWNSRMRTTAGRAFWPEGKIELNPKLVELAPEEIQATMLHELAHVLAYARAGRRRISAHGAEWRQACRDLGIPNEKATHSLPLPGRTMKRKWRYTCPECGDGFDRVRRMKRYAGCYACCKQHNGGYYHKKFRLVETELD